MKNYSHTNYDVINNRPATREKRSKRSKRLAHCKCWR